MITAELARRLRDEGLPWVPAKGDRFLVPDRDLDDEVFVISDMVVEVREVGVGRLLAFNGTTEWALDSILQREVIWLPREDQLRELLGPRFVSLTRRPEGYVVEVELSGESSVHADVDAECAYARALLTAPGWRGPC